MMGTRHSREWLSRRDVALCHDSRLVNLGYFWTRVPGNGEVEMEVKLEVKMEVEMDAPILQPNYTGAQAPQYT